MGPESLRRYIVSSTKAKTLLFRLNDIKRRIFLFRESENQLLRPHLRVIEYEG
jgi:hypothetical protein